jgi:alpha-soluble NSF attachment protein
VTAKCFEESINHHVDSNQFSQAAKLYQEMAELYLAQQQVDEAVDYYFKANDAFANANSATSGYQCLIKAADALVSQKQYKKAIGLYEKVAAQSYNDLGKWSVKEYFFKALLSQLANEQKEFVSNVEMAKTSMGKYMEEFPQFRDTREQQFVQKLIDAFEEESEEKFGDAVFEFDRISRLNPWFTALVAEVKKQLVKGDEADLL